MKTDVLLGGVDEDFMVKSLYLLVNFEFEGRSLVRNQGAETFSEVNNTPVF